MKLLLTSIVLLTSALDPLAPQQGKSTERPAAPAHPAPSMDELLKPGPQHALLQKLAGNWDALVITPTPDGAEQRTRGTKTTTRLADYHTIDSFEGEFMGIKFVGQGLNGYCPVRKQYFTYWTDSMTPSGMTVYGDYDAKTRELAMNGECFGMSGGLEKCRTVTKFVDDDHVQWAMYGAGLDGKEVQHLRIEYTRKR